jgi:hypothetical protein
MERNSRWPTRRIEKFVSETRLIRTIVLISTEIFFQHNLCLHLPILWVRLGQGCGSIFGGRDRGDVRPMMAGRQEVRDSARRFTANAFGWRLVCTIETTGQHDLLLTDLPPPLRFHNLNDSRTVETVYPAGYRPGRHRRQPHCVRRQRTAVRPPIQLRPDAAALARAVIPSCARGERS